MKSELEVYDEEAFGEDTLCTICNAEFLDTEDLTVHIRQMHGITPAYCQFCPETHTDLEKYASHVIETHLSDLRSCQYCTKVFLVRANLKKHENKHKTIPNVYSCSQCESIFPEIGRLEQHERENHNNAKDGCFLQCMPFISSLLNLRAVALLQSVGKITFECSGCNFSSTNLPDYKKHLEIRQCKVYVCDRCSSVFKSKRYLATHLLFAKKCLGVKQGTKCKHCKIEVPDGGMPQHLKTCIVLRCMDCNLVCKSIGELSNHQAIEHPLDMTVIRCGFCLKEFIGKLPLKKHIFRVHRPSFHLYKYKCFDCNVIFKHPQKLFAHFYTKHKNLEPFNCKICNKKFRIRKAFSLHIKLDHKSVGFVEFDDRYHVFFTANKSETPFVPECVVPQEMFDEFDEDPNLTRYSIRSRDLLETDATDVETEDDKPSKRKLSPIKRKAKKAKTVEVYSSDEEPLLEVKKRMKKKKAYGKNWTWRKNKLKKSQFTCSICNKNCYTYQNYQNHLSLHNEDQDIECVKCSKRFNSKEQLKTHMSKEHSTSKLTETLKSLLEKKKHEFTEEPTCLTVPKKPEKFTITMKKVATDNSNIVSATIKPVEADLNVKNFLENFTPELNETPKANIQIDSSISITQHHNPIKKSMIKLTKFKDEPKLYQPVPLKMPERFHHEDYVRTKVTVKVVQEPSMDYILPESEHNYSEAFQDEDNDGIPEVAHEISLVGTEEPIQPITRIVIPKMPKGYSKIHIATLQSEAPYFKIIKVDSDNLTEIKENIIEESEPTKREVIDLPGGTKLVTANPLAHLLKDTQLDKILEPVKNKYYKPVIKDFSGMLAQAMQKLEEVPQTKKRKVKPKTEIEVVE